MPARRRVGPFDLRFWKTQTLKRLEKDFLRAVLQAHGGNVTRTAEALGVYRSTLQRLMRKHNLTAA
jgi:transcriptional regulator of acetoin/glycerol metabolism